MRFNKFFTMAPAIWMAFVAISSAAHADDINITFQGTIDPMFGIEGNYHHGVMTDCGYQHVSEQCNGSARSPYGAWFDGPINPYKFGSETYFQIPHSQNYRIKVTGNNWGARHLWQLEPNNTVHGATITPADSDLNQSHYQMRNWIFSPYVQYPNIYGLTHHEWYSSVYFVNGIPFWSQASNAATVWGIGWTSSADGGNTWAMNPINYSAPSNSNRMVMIPEPWNPSLPQFYGFSHPSNIVKEGIYYYAFVTNVSQKSGGQQALGVSLIRTSNLASSSAWQYWNGSGWTTVSHGTYQGNGGPQQPYIFWESPGACSHLYAHNVRKHASSGKWIVLGADFCAGFDQYGNIAGKAVYTWIDSLANPIYLDKTSTNQPRPPKVVAAVGNYIPFNAYYSFFDVSGSSNVGDNFEVVNNTPLFTAINPGKNTILHQFLSISYTP